MPYRSDGQPIKTPLRKHMAENEGLLEEGKRRCAMCNRVKALHLYYKHSNMADGYRYVCKSCFKQRYPQARDHARASAYIRKYGITLDEYEALLASQDGKCYSCGMKAKKKRLAVDHDWEQGNPRGLLCTPCNRFLGRIHDDPATLRKMADYLETPPALVVLDDRDWTPYQGKRT